MSDFASLYRSRDRRINRYYDIATGQFISVDPNVSSTETPFAYGADNPVSETDLLGLCGKWNGPHYDWYFRGTCHNPEAWHRLLHSDEQEDAKLNFQIAHPGIFARIGNALHSVGHWIAAHKVAVGIGLGIAGVLTGGIGLIAGSTLLGVASVGLGGTAFVLDYSSCKNHLSTSNNACWGAGLGLVSTGFGIGAGLLGGTTAAEGLGAVAVKFGVAGAIWDLTTSLFHRHG